MVKEEIWTANLALGGDADDAAAEPGAGVAGGQAPLIAARAEVVLVSVHN